MAVSEAKVMEIAARRQRVMQLRVRGFTRKNIAEQVGVSLSTVKGDLAELMDGMKRNAAEDMGRWRKMSEARYRYVVNEMSKRMESDEDTKSAAAAGKVLVNAQTRMDKVRGVDAPQLIDTNLNLDTGTLVLPPETPIEQLEADAKEWHSQRAVEEVELRALPKPKNEED